jgi:uncharacterized protein (TIGR02596 family)
MKKFTSRFRGFSLLELLVVMLIIGIVAAFVVPSASTILRGSQLQQASQTISDQFNLARQYALSTNHPVEVRLIRYADPEVPGEVMNGVSNPTNGNYRAVQILETLDAINPATGDFARIALDKPQLFPQAIIMDTGALSTLIHDASSGSTTDATPSVTPLICNATSADPPMPRKVGTNYVYIAFRFLPDGSTNLPPKSLSDPSGQWFVTLHNLTDTQGGATPPPNFFTLQVDPVSGTLKQFRPGI